MILNEKLSLPVFPDENSFYEVKGLLKSASENKVLVRFSPEKGHPGKIDGLWPTPDGSHYRYLENSSHLEPFSVVAHMPPEQFGKVTVTIERWKGRGEIELLFESFVGSPKILYVGNRGVEDEIFKRFPVETITGSSIAFSKLEAELKHLAYDVLLVDLDSFLRAEMRVSSFTPELGEKLRRLASVASPRRVVFVAGDRHLKAEVETNAFRRLGEKPAYGVFDCGSDDHFSEVLHELMVEEELLQPVHDGGCLSAVDKPFRDIEALDVISLCDCASAFELAFDCVADHSIKPKDCLVSFEIAKIEAGEIVADQTIDFRVDGLYLSGDPSIGHFKYLDLRPGVGRYHVDVDLPAGLVCTGMRFMRFGRERPSIEIANVKVQLKNSPRQRDKEWKV